MSELNEPRPCLGSIMLYYRCWLGMATGFYSIIHFLVILCSNNIDIYLYISIRYPLYIFIHCIMSNFSPIVVRKKQKKLDVSPSATSRADARDGQVVRPAEVAWHRVALDFGIFRVSLKIGDTHKL